MTKEEAIKILDINATISRSQVEFVEAAKMAIEALKQEDVKSAQWIRTKFYG